ncbi:MAG: hypothetical protein FD131_3288 [Rhodocyclaceae bacterium]|nr:MAG: hypothetical protein FD131_3288 [Rhodocyclaceae bacterium]
MTIRSVTFHSEQEAVRLLPSPSAAIISITNPGDIAPLRDGWGSILRLAFADASYDERTIASYGRMWRLSSHGFPTKEHALAIRGFLDGIPPHTDSLIVHCGAGVSRSGAVAKYASGLYGLPFPPDYNRHNDALYRLLEDPNVFDEVLARYPDRKPSLLQLAASLFGLRRSS